MVGRRVSVSIPYVERLWSAAVDVRDDTGRALAAARDLSWLCSGSQLMVSHRALTSADPHFPRRGCTAVPVELVHGARVSRHLHDVLLI